MSHPIKLIANALGVPPEYMIDPGKEPASPSPPSSEPGNTPSSRSTPGWT